MLIILHMIYDFFTQFMVIVITCMFDYKDIFVTFMWLTGLMLCQTDVRCKIWVFKQNQIAKIHKSFAFLASCIQVMALGHSESDSHTHPHILTRMHLFISYVSLFSLTNEWQVDTSFGKINRTTQYLRRRDSQLSHHLSPRLSFWLKTTRPCNQNYLELVGNLRLHVSFFLVGGKLEILDT